MFRVFVLLIETKEEHYIFMDESLGDEMDSAWALRRFYDAVTDCFAEIRMFNNIEISGRENLQVYLDRVTDDEGEANKMVVESVLATCRFVLNQAMNYDLILKNIEEAENDGAEAWLLDCYPTRFRKI
jgi:hypothetical protein